MISIVNRKYNTPKNPWDIVIDRTSPFGNPFPMDTSKDRVQQRELVCDMYHIWFYEKIENDFEFKAQVEELVRLYRVYRKLTLFCWCHPFRCHGETIKRYIENICKEK